MAKQIMSGQKYTVLGSTDYPVCDCCGKTNLTRAVGLESEHGEILNVGVICASKLLRQRYIMSIGNAAKRSDEWKQRNGYGAASFKLVAA